MSQIQFDQLNDYLKDKIYSIGCDEVGYGSIAGPLVVCGIKAPKNWSLDGLNDSKKLSEKRRDIMRSKLLPLIENKTIEIYLAERSNQEIDNVGLGVALKNCYVEIFKKLYTNDSLIICDGNLKFDNLNIDQVSLVKADGLVPSVMAASILAKTYRDSKMKEYHIKYPQYGWDNNVGYYGANGLQIAAIKKYGYSPLHRLSYKLKILDGMSITVNE